uniref:Uncharacterized protein n=1 Tax=Rhizophora mucronata TaxID=61149 RepID=A0A2P2JU87_RHIMU
MYGLVYVFGDEVIEVHDHLPCYKHQLEQKKSEN